MSNTKNTKTKTVSETPAKRGRRAAFDGAPTTAKMFHFPADTIAQLHALNDKRNKDKIGNQKETIGETMARILNSAHNNSFRTRKAKATS